MNAREVVALLVLLFAAFTAQGAPWDLWKGEAYVSLGTSFTHHEEVVLYDGTHMDVGDFDFLSYQLGAQYGITDRLAATLLVPYERNEGDGPMAPEVSGVGDLRLGVRGRILDEGKRSPVLAAALTIKVPGSDYRTDVLSAPGDGQMDTELRLLTGQSFSLGGRSGAWGLEAGYRFRSGSPGNEIVAYGELGMEIAWRLHGRLFVDHTDQLDGYGLGAPGWTDGDFPAVAEDVSRVGLGLSIPIAREIALDLRGSRIVRVESSAPGWHLGVSVVLHRLGL